MSPSGGLLLQNVRIEIHGMIQSGTTLQIGNRQMTLTTTISNRIFRLNDTCSDLVALPLRRRR